ncbi:MAG: [LysW]-aminoadipate kinase, partial [Chloroflexi bacterium]|nr:[LysW]-aminoadipate kinase [Chloroflexota bacterium]
FVVKVGGGEGIDLDAVCADLAELAHAGRRWVLVHGGSHETNVVATQLDHPPQFITSVSGFTSRRTDRRTLEIFEMVYCGKVNKGIVEQLQRRGVNALGLSGVDGRLLEGPRKKALRIVDPQTGRRRIIRDDLTGKVERVNAELLRLLLDAGYWPVISPPAISYEGEAVNVDGDRAAAAIAAALGAETLLILSNVPGLLRNFPDESSLIRHVPAGKLDEAMAYAEGRMRIKLLGAGEALKAGVQRVVLGDSRREKPVQAALDGEGTGIQ